MACLASDLVLNMLSERRFLQGEPLTSEVQQPWLSMLSPAQHGMRLANLADARMREP